MNNDEVAQLLKDFRSYEYAAINCGSVDGERLPLMLSERMQFPGKWDRSRYNRIVGIVKGAVDYCLDDDQRTVIMRKYLDRNKLHLNEIATILHKDRTTIGKWHTEALNILAKALATLDPSEYEITNFDHKFDKNWKFKEPQESA